MKSLLISPFPVERQPREYQVARWLRELGTVSIASPTEPETGFEWLRIPSVSSETNIRQKLLILGELILRLPLASPKGLGREDSVPKIDLDKFDIISVHDLKTLATVISQKPKAAVIFDAMEYYPEEEAESLKFKLLHQKRILRHCRELFPQCAAVTTPSPGWIPLYRNLTKVEPTLLTSAKPFVDLPFESRDSDQIRLVYHGGIDPNRGIRFLCDLVDQLDDRFSLDLMLVGGAAEVEEIAARAALTKRRCRVVPPVAPSEIVAQVAQYDLGLILYPVKTLQLRFCLPNKLFEYVQARLGVVVGPHEDIAQVANEWGFGVGCESSDPSEVAPRLNGLSRKDVEKLRLAAHRAAGTLNVDAQKSIFMSVVHRLLENQ
jgi:hypothetical protein